MDGVEQIVYINRYINTNKILRSFKKNLSVYEIPHIFVR